MTSVQDWVRVAALAALVAARVESAGYIDVTITEQPSLQVRYTSGRVVCVEAIDDGRWIGRYWSSDGRINVTGEGWADAAFEVEIDRTPLTHGWACVSAREVPRTDRGVRHVNVALKHTRRSVRVNVHTLLDGTPVLTRWLEITNTSNEPISLTAVAPWSGRLWQSKQVAVGYFTKSVHSFEGWFDWQPVGDAPVIVECTRGQGHDDPFFVARNDGVGGYFIGHLAWSANWRMSFRRDRRGTLFKIGPSAQAPLRVIAPGETITTPAVHLGHVSGSLDAAVQGMHDHIRRFVLPEIKPGRAYRIQYVVPADQGYYTPFDEASALKCVDVAAAIGAELFILDAYWWDVTMDWVPSAKRFPRGLEPVIQRVREKGMLFGLYVEAEGGRGNVSESKVAKAHPEWLGPNDTINLAVPEAAAWVESEIVRLVEQYRLDLFRLDYNPQNTGEGIVAARDGRSENNYWRYYEACYAMYERLHRRYPNLILQQAAAGGARNDLGTVSRFHESYVTDGLIIPREIQGFSGLTLGLPPEIFLILHGAIGRFNVPHPQNFDTILRLSFALGTPQIFVGMVAPSVETLSPERRARFLHYGAIYKDFIRPLLPTCKVFHHEPVNAHGGVESSGWFAMEFAAPDRRKGWATVIRIGPSDSDTYILRPRGLDPALRYQVTWDRLDTTVTVDGLSLIRDGLPVRLESVASSDLLRFEAKSPSGPR